VAGFVWFNEKTDDGYDFRLDSSAKSLRAFQSGLSQANLAKT
jgi:hypothetical protein